MSKVLLQRYITSVVTLALLAGCGGGGTASAPFPQDVPPGKHEGIQLAVVRGASGAPSGVKISWTRVDNVEVQGYYIYRDTATIPSGDPTGNEALRVNGGNMIDQSGSGSETLTFDDLFDPNVGDTFYYRMTVVNQTDDESDFSNEESITIAEHTVDSVSQAGGSIGDTVTITGTHFGETRDGDLVYFTSADGDTDVVCASGDYISWGQTEIEVKIPYGAADGVVGVSIAGTMVVSVDTIDYNEPTITDIDPGEDYVAHNYVTITGTDFGPKPSEGGTLTDIYFAGSPAQAGDIDEDNWTDTQIVVKVPAAAVGKTVDVYVSVAGNDSADASFIILPHIDSIDPVTGATGTSVEVVGTNFDSSQDTGTVTVNGVSASVSVWDNESVTFTIPGSAVDGNVVVTRDDSKTTSIGFDVSPTLSSFTPTRREPGQDLTINGTGFGTSRGSSTVRFLGGSGVDASNYVSWSSTQIVVTVPTGAKTGQVKVTISDASVGSNNDTVTSSGSPAVLLPPPVIDDTGQI